jgi:plastocyanin
MLPRRILLALIVAPVGLASVSAHAATIQIVMDKLVFSPVETQAKVGDTIEWVNRDILAHTATATAGADWNVIIGPNKTEKLVVQKAGTVDYYCKYHPNMKGRLVIAP